MWIQNEMRVRIKRNNFSKVIANLILLLITTHLNSQFHLPLPVTSQCIPIHKNYSKIETYDSFVVVLLRGESIFHLLINLCQWNMYFPNLNLNTHPWLVLINSQWVFIVSDWFFQGALHEFSTRYLHQYLSCLINL